MDSKQFVRVYPQTLSPDVIHRGDHSKFIPEAQDWSYAFGQRLHADLAGEQSESAYHPVNDMNYWNWSTGLDDMEQDLIVGAKEDSEARYHALNELNFHIMNNCMHGLWKPIQDGGWGSEGNRLHRIGIAERALAARGFLYFASKNMADTTALFDGELQGINRVFTGKAQEFDAVLVMMGAARRNPNWTIVPAPLNFERTKKRINVDFIVTDCVERRSVGVQVKTNVRNHDYEQADKERVVFIDGTVDLDNVRAMRTRRKSSAIQTVPWPGIIATKLVDGMKPKQHGMVLNHFVKKTAHELVGDTKVDYSGVVDKIEERILAKL